MKYYLAVFSSITYANRLKKILDNMTGFVSLMHAPSEIAENGCAYCLRFRPEQYDVVNQTAMKYNIKIKGLYVEENNKYEKLMI